MAQRESKLSRDIMDALRKRGYFCFKIHADENTMTGLPDIIVCAQGLFIGLETKMPDKRGNTSARQRFIHEQIEYCGGACFVVCGVSEAVKVVGSYLEKVTIVKKP